MGTIEKTHGPTVLAQPVERRLGPDTRNKALRNVTLGVAVGATAATIGVALKLPSSHKAFAAIPAAIAGVTGLIAYSESKDTRPTGRVIAENVPGDHVLSIAREAGGIVNVIPEGRPGLTLFTSGAPMTTSFVQDGVPLELGNNVGSWPFGSDPDYNLNRYDGDRFTAGVTDSRLMTSKERRFLGSVVDLRRPTEATPPAAA